jgi:hypothetical protein
MKAFHRASEPGSTRKLFRGLPIRNATGSAMSAGNLVYVSSWSETYKRFLVTLADADAAGRGNAVFVLRTAISNNQNGYGYKTHRLQSLNTSAASAVGDPVYLSTTAGGWTLTAPASSGGVNQIVGRVAVDDATVGEVEFDLELGLATGGAATSVALEGIIISGLRAAQTDGSALRAGTSSSYLTDDTASMKFIACYFDNGATSGDMRGMYLRLALTGSGTGGGEAARIFTNADANLGTCHGAHISLDFAASAGGSECSGLGAAVRGTLHIPNIASWAPTGTYASGMFEIYSDGSDSDPAGMTKLSVLRLANSGDATGRADVDDDADLIELVGWTSATGNMYYGATLRVDAIGTKKYLILSEDENRLDLSSINVDAANTDGGVIKLGTSSAYITEDTANMKFISCYFDNGATSGDNRGMYLRLALTGAGTGGGEAARIFTNCDNNMGTCHGAHISLDFAASAGGSECSGLGVAVRGTLHIPNIASWAPTGTYAAGMFEIYNDGSDSDPAGMTELSFLRLVNGGDTTGAADVDDDAFLLSLQGFSEGTGNLFSAGADVAAAATLRIKVGATSYYILLATSESN